jgi:penicillin-binding protein 1A
MKNLKTKKSSFPSLEVRDILSQETDRVKKRTIPIDKHTYLIGNNSRHCNILLDSNELDSVNLLLTRENISSKKWYWPFNRNKINCFIENQSEIYDASICKHRKLNILSKSKKLEFGKEVRINHNETITIGNTTIKYLNPPSIIQSLTKYLAISILIPSVPFFSAITVAKIQADSIDITNITNNNKGFQRPITLLDHEGKIFYKRDSQGSSIADFPPQLINALIEKEDKNFWDHNGVEFLALIRSAYNKSGGGGTITMQLARTAFSEKICARNGDIEHDCTKPDPWRKLLEIFLAMRIESKSKGGKNEILLNYLNRANLGDVNGFKEAAHLYFDKGNIKDITLSESATLVAMLPAPAHYDICRNRSFSISILTKDRNFVLNKLANSESKDRLISSLDRDNAEKEIVHGDEKFCGTSNSQSVSYFADFVILKELRDRVGESTQQRGNLQVKTSYHPVFQEKAESTLKKLIDKGRNKYNISQGVIVTLDTRNGEVMSMVGGSNYSKNSYNFATGNYSKSSNKSLYPAASTFKIFTLIAALDSTNKSSPAASLKTTFSCFPYKKEQSERLSKGCLHLRGMVDMYNATALSENVVFARIGDAIKENLIKESINKIALGSKENPINESNVDSELKKEITTIARKLGVLTIECGKTTVNDFILGACEVNPLEMAGAYSVIANNGIRNAPHAIRSVVDVACLRSGNEDKCKSNSYENPLNNKEVISPYLANQVTGLLQGVIKPGSTGQDAKLGLGEAGKTGTDGDGDKNSNLWFIGYIPSKHLLTCIWLGNDKKGKDAAIIEGGSSIAAKLWHDYMIEIVSTKGEM